MSQFQKYVQGSTQISKLYNPMQSGGHPEIHLILQKVPYTLNQFARQMSPILRKLFGENYHTPENVRQHTAALELAPQSMRKSVKQQPRQSVKRRAKQQQQQQQQQSMKGGALVQQQTGRGYKQSIEDYYFSHYWVASVTAMIWILLTGIESQDQQVGLEIIYADLMYDLHNLKIERVPDGPDLLLENFMIERYMTVQMVPYRKTADEISSDTHLGQYRRKRQQMQQRMPFVYESSIPLLEPKSSSSEFMGIFSLRFIFTTEDLEESRCTSALFIVIYYNKIIAPSGKTQPTLLFISPCLVGKEESKQVSVKEMKLSEFEDKLKETHMNEQNEEGKGVLLHLDQIPFREFIPFFKPHVTPEILDESIKKNKFMYLTTWGVCYFTETLPSMDTYKKNMRSMFGSSLDSQSGDASSPHPPLVMYSGGAAQG